MDVEDNQRIIRDVMWNTGLAPAFSEPRSHVDNHKTLFAEWDNLPQNSLTNYSAIYYSADPQLSPFGSTYCFPQIGELPRQPDPNSLAEYIVKNNVAIELPVLDDCILFDECVDDVTPMEVSSNHTAVQDSVNNGDNQNDNIEARLFSNEQNLVNFFRNFQDSEDSATTNQEQSQEVISDLEELLASQKTNVSCNSVSDGAELNQNSEEKIYDTSIESVSSSHLSEPSPSCSYCNIDTPVSAPLASNRKTRGKPKFWTRKSLEDKKEQLKQELREAKENLSSTPEDVAEIKLRYKHASNHLATFKRDEKNNIYKDELEAAIKKEMSKKEDLINQLEQNRTKLEQIAALLERYQ